jgi:HlyD family secretion protein
MTRRRYLPALVAVIAVAGIGAWYGLAPERASPSGFQGYVEGNLVLIGPEEGGRIEVLKVEAGDRVQEGAMLFELDAALQKAQRLEAEAKLHQAEAQLADFRAALQRPEQIAVLKAQEERAQAQLDYSRSELERQRTLFDRGYTAQARLDQAQSTFDRDRAALAEIKHQIEAGQIAGRTAEIMAAEATVQAAQAMLGQAETRLSKRRVNAPAEALVQDVYFRPGEVVNAGQPVLGLLPPTNRRIRFYVPEPRLSTLTLGATVAIACDSCPGDLQGRIVFISREAEFTPPVIFSEEERAKLVFRVEAQPTGDWTLPIGLPVTVTAADRRP